VVITVTSLSLTILFLVATVAIRVYIKTMIFLK